MTITASAPGSIMITGEHAVVYGHPAIVAAIAQRVQVTVTPRSGHAIQITSAVGDLETTLDDLPEGGPLRFVAACLRALAPTGGLRIDITSEIDPTLGLGSSAAVTVAMLGALGRLSGRAVDIHGEALAIVRRIQGRGSGADLAASLHGGMITYQIDHGPRHLPMPPPLALKNCGYKTPTGEVLAQVARAWAGRDVATVYARMGAAAEAAISAAQAQDWVSMAEALTQYQQHMRALGVSDATLDALVEEGARAAQAAKISGSGLGDCVLAFGGVPGGWAPALVAEQGLVLA